MISPSSTAGARPALHDAARSLTATSVSDRACWLVVAVAVAVRLLLLWPSAGMGPRIVDEQHYTQLASSLVHGDGFAWGPSQPTSIRPPLYPMFVAALWRLSGTESTDVVRAVQVALGGLAVLLVYLIGVRVFDRRTALLSALALAVYPSLLFSGVLLLTEVLFTTLLLATVYFVLRVLDDPRWTMGMAAGLALGLAALTRSVMWPFPILLVPFLLVTVRGGLARRALVCAALLLGFVVIVGPWSARNTRLQRTFEIVDTMGGLNLLMGNYEYTPEDRMWDAVSLTGAQSWDEPLRHMPVPPGGWTEGMKDHWAQQRALAFITAHPMVSARRAALKFADLWGLEREWIAGVQQGLYQPPLWFSIASSTAVILAFPIVLIAGIAGLFLAPPDNRRAHWLFVLVLLFVSALHTITFGHSRYHLPLMPVLMLYGAAALGHRALVASALRSRAALAPACAVGLAVLVWTHEVLFRDSAHVAALLRVLGLGA